MARFKMVGKDINSSPLQHRVWVVEDEPDYKAEQYNGLKSGKNDFEDVIAYMIEDDNAIVDFNFPLIAPISKVVAWETTQKVLPYPVTDGQFAIVDDKGYIFGGHGSDRILTCNLENPTSWYDSGSVLPHKLSGSSFARIDDTIYLFGGQGDLVSENVYSAPVSDPLNWQDHGYILPAKLKKSNLAIINDYIYLFGGHGSSKPSDSIYRAPISNPFLWEDTGNKLPMPVFNSQIGIIGNNIYLFGGENNQSSVSKKIMVASLSSPESWSIAGDLPFPIFRGQFIIVGNKGYIIGTAGIGSDTQNKFITKIIKCNLNNPLNWYDTKKYIPANISNFQLGIIDDRMFLFGGNGLTAIYANNYRITYNFANQDVIAYGENTRTNFLAASTDEDKFKVLGFPHWITNY